MVLIYLTIPTGPYQNFASKLPADSPELQFGIFVYDYGVMLAEQVLTVTGITIENEGSLSGVENLVIGPNGVIILRYVKQNRINTIYRISKISFFFSKNC